MVSSRNLEQDGVDARYFTKLGPRPSSGSAFVKKRVSASLTSNG